MLCRGEAALVTCGDLCDPTLNLPAIASLRQIARLAPGYRAAIAAAAEGTTVSGRVLQGEAELGAACRRCWGGLSATQASSSCHSSRRGRENEQGDIRE